MRRVELELEHHYKNKFIGRHRLTSNTPLTVLGSAQNADIRLMGDDVSSIHAYVEFEKDAWKIIDAGSKQGTWINKEPITSIKLGDETVAKIGGHELRIKARTLDFELFGPSDLEGKSDTGNTLYHQVILRKNGHVVHTELLKAGESYNFPYSDDNTKYKSPKKGEFLENSVGKYTVQQRLVRSGNVQYQPKNVKEHLMRKEVQAGLLGLFAVAFVATLLVVTMPNGLDQEKEPEKMKKNAYTKMIFNSSVVKKKRAEAIQRQRAMASKSANKTPVKAKPVTSPVQSKGNRPKVVSKLKMKGLTQLLGKIAARASKNGVKIVSRGKSAADKNSARAGMTATGTLQGVKTQAGNNGKTFKVNGVATLGKGGGTSVQGTAGLALGGVGSASVGVLDDETIIDGGLDKDVIARVINSHLGEIRYCYERQLSAQPDIYGKVVVKFSIDSRGLVATQRVGVTTLRSAMVEGCILRRVASWKFPVPKGGTEVLVTYPFLFKSTN